VHRSHLSYRGVRTTRHSEIRLEKVTRFEEELSTACPNLPKTHIINVDESMWFLFWQSRKIVADIGVESINTGIYGDPKAEFTLIGSIAANGDTLPLFLDAKERTCRYHKQFSPGFLGAISHSKSGWVNHKFSVNVSYFFVGAVDKEQLL
jgi:hypothetical protein